MRLVHLSDLHLGFRQFQRLTPAGINQREADVASAFKRAVDETIARRPDLVLLGGDIFHNVRPTNPAILHAFAQFSRLARELPDALLVMVAGNHDTPRSSETGCLLRLFAPLGVHVVDAEARRLAFPERDLAILAVPDVPGAKPALVPDESARYNVLLLHGEVEGMLRHGAAAAADRASVEVSREELGAARWDYVALGHYHVYREVAPNAFYSGSIEYTSTNPWEELYEERIASIPGKGFIEHDLETGEHRFHHLPPARPFVDLPPVSARGLAVAECDAAIRAALEACPGGVDDKVVRLLVRDIPRHIARDLDHRALREFKRRALHFHLDTRRPEIIRTSASGSPGRRPTIAEIVREQLRGRLLEGDIDRDSLIALGLQYLTEAEAVDAAAGAPVAESA
jgi:DNA repair exonuclease SbcCD nuclease subunit